MRKHKDENIKTIKHKIKLNTWILYLRNLNILDIIGRILLGIVAILFWLYIIITPIYYDVDLSHLTNWGLIMGCIFYSILFVGTFFPPILRFGLIILLTTYHAFLYLIFIGILVIIAYNPSIVQESIDEHGLSNTLIANFLVHYFPVILFYVVFYIFIYERAKVEYDDVFSTSKYDRNYSSDTLYIFLQIFLGAGTLTLIYLLVFDPTIEYNVPELPFVLVLLADFLIIFFTNGSLIIIFIFKKDDFKNKLYDNITINNTYLSLPYKKKISKNTNISKIP